MTQEQAQWEDDVRQSRLSAQVQKNDYEFNDDGEKEKCEDCRTPLNSHGHCPNCDY